MEWRILPLEVQDAFAAMATDEAIAETVARGATPTIRFWRWKPSAVSVGYFQSMEDEVNLQKCKELGVDVVRRRTGGGAVYHDYEGELTYSIIVPEKIMPAGITESYRLICGWLIDGLARLGIEAEFVPINDICVAGRKISGNAQTRRNGVLLQHGTILYDLDVKKMFSLLRVGQEKISDKMIKSVEERVTRVLNHSNASFEEVHAALLAGLAGGKKIKQGVLTEGELVRAAELAEGRYKTRAWNFLR